MLDDERIKCWRAEAVAAVEATPGSVVASDADGVVVACAEGALRLLELQTARQKASQCRAVFGQYELAWPATVSDSGNGAKLRATAAQIIDDVIARGHSLDRALAEHEQRVASRDHALLRNLSYGTLRYHWHLQAWITWPVVATTQET